MMEVLLALALSLQDRPQAWDTGSASAEPLMAETLAAKRGWGPLAEPLKGDAVLSNGLVTAVVRRQGACVELYGGSVLRARLEVAGAGGLERAAIAEQGRSTSSLGVAWKSAAATLRLKRGDVSLEIDPGAGAERLQVECPSRFAVLPDFFADDIVIDAAKIPVATAELPSENFIMHLAGNGDAIALCVFENREQDVRVALAGDGEMRLITGTEIQFGKGRKIWVALIEGAGIWHAFEVGPGEGKKVKALDWTMPFPAAWRLDFTRHDGLTDSWEMLLQQEKGHFLKPSWLGAESDRIKADRKRWTTVLGEIKYPCWIDTEGRGHVQPLKEESLLFRGPAVIYPINRVEGTPAGRPTLVTAVRNTLGVGPCEYILDVEGQKQEYKGRATCSVRDTLTPLYQKGQQLEQRAKIEKTLDEGLAFVRHIRGRITLYVEFGRKLREHLAEQASARPELRERIAELEKLAAEIDTRFDARREAMKTPAHVETMNEDFRKNVLEDASDQAPARCKAYTKALVEIGDNQDELSGELRWVARALRQKAGLLMATEPKMAPIAAEIRKRTQEVLRNPASHEGARH